MKPSPDARSLAISILEALERRESYADAALHAALARHPRLPARERALVGQLVYGVLRWRNRLDAHLQRASRRPLGRIHPLLLQILRVGAYQVLFLDRVPAHAAVDRAVEETRRRGLGHAAGFVNAVLRRVARDGPDLPLPEALPDRLALLFGCPGWLVERWIREHGPAGAEALCRASSRVPELWLRVDTRRLDREEAVRVLRDAGLGAEPGRHGPEAVRVEARGDPRRLPLVRDGLAVVQDQASQLIAHYLAPERGWSILDACAGPGLKATHLGMLAGPDARVVALDVHPARAREVARLAARCAVPNVRVLAGDARRPPLEAPFDAVLVDAPCSGLGTLSRTPEAKWRRAPGEIAALPGLQEALLEGVAHLVRPGGVLVYATCTTLAAENEEVVGRFLGRHPEFRAEPPPEGPVAWGPLLDPQGFLRTYPEALGQGAAALDGFFAARLRRRRAP